MGTQHFPEQHQSSDSPQVDALVSTENIFIHALEVREQFGAMCAIEYLKSNNVDSAHIIDVLKSQH